MVWPNALKEMSKREAQRRRESLFTFLRIISQLRENAILYRIFVDFS